MENSRMCIVAAGLVLFLHLIHSANSIKCWSCNSHTERGCEDPLDTKRFSMIDCSIYYPRNTTNVCRKIRQEVNGQWRFIRGCAFLAEPSVTYEQCSVPRTSTNIFFETCTCGNQDGCNSAPFTHAPKYRHHNNF